MSRSETVGPSSADLGRPRMGITVLCATAGAGFVVSILTGCTYSVHEVISAEEAAHLIRETRDRLAKQCIAVNQIDSRAGSQ